MRDGEVIQLLEQVACSLRAVVCAISSSRGMSLVSELIVSAEEAEDVVDQNEGLERNGVRAHHH